MSLQNHPSINPTTMPYLKNSFWGLFLACFFFVGLSYIVLPKNEAAISPLPPPTTVLLDSPSLADSIYQYLRHRGSLDLPFLSEELPLLFFWSGFIFSPTEEEALLIRNPSDQKYEISLLSLVKGKWNLHDQLLVEGNPVEFACFLEDFNFDGTKDLFLQTSISNGYPVSKGHLILVDEPTRKLSLVQEAIGLGNLSVDSLQQLLISEEVIWCEKDASRSACKLYHHWKQGVLVLEHKDCPCIPEQY